MEFESRQQQSVLPNPKDKKTESFLGFQTLQILISVFEFVTNDTVPMLFGWFSRPSTKPPSPAPADTSPSAKSILVMGPIDDRSIESGWN
jgi:hypothetical protein